MTAPAIDLAALTPRQLLSLYSQILSELIARSVVRSRNAPAGDYAELLVATAYGGELSKGSAKSYDVVTTDARRLQAKSRVIVEGDKRAQSFSPFRSFDVDACVFVLFDSVSYRVVHGLEIETSLVAAMAREVVWVAGRRVTVRQVLSCSSARDVTGELQAAQDQMEVPSRPVPA